MEIKQDLGLYLTLFLTQTLIKMAIKDQIMIKLRTTQMVRMEEVIMEGNRMEEVIMEEVKMEMETGKVKITMVHNLIQTMVKTRKVKVE